MGMIMPLLPLMPLADVLPSRLPQAERTEAMLKMVPVLKKVMPKGLREQFGGFLDAQTVEVGLPAVRAFSAYIQDLRMGIKGRKKLILHPFNFPPEILHALDTAPVFIELLSTIPAIASAVFKDGAERYLDHCFEKGLPRSLCSGQLGGAGAILFGDVPKPDLILSGAPGMCDVNSKIMQYTAQTLNIPAIHSDIPAYHDERGLNYYKASFRDALSQLEEFTGRKLEPEKLREVVENSNKLTELYHEINELKRAVPNPVPNIYTLLSYGMKFTMGGRKEAIPVFKAVLDSSKRKLKKGEGALPEEKVRALWIYTSIYFDPMLIGWFNEVGMSILMDLTAWFPMSPIDTSNTDTMIDGLAEESLNFPMTRQMRGAWDDADGWAEDMVFLAKKLKADCCIFSGNPACKRAWGSLRLLSDRLKEDVGIPTVTLDADSWDGRITSMPVVKEKIEDFIEAII